MICDFCNAPNPVWRFRARPFLIDYGPITGESDADWAACNACREMILADDRNGLVDRAMLMAPAIPDLPEADVRELRRWSQGLLERIVVLDAPATGFRGAWVDPT
jgi:hypothetical protein